MNDQIEFLRELKHTLSRVLAEGRVSEAVWNEAKDAYKDVSAELVKLEKEIAS